WYCRSRPGASGGGPARPPGRSGCVRHTRPERAAPGPPGAASVAFACRPSSLASRGSPPDQRDASTEGRPHRGRMADDSFPLTEVDATARALAPSIRETPAWPWRDELVERLL